MAKGGSGRLSVGPRSSWAALLLLAGAGFGLTMVQAPAAAQPPAARGIRKPSITDTIRATIYADNWFELYVNGTLVAVDSIAFIPHNVISVDLLPAYPMTIAVLAKDNADPQTGMEYANTNIGDAGFILRFGDGTVTSSAWKAKCFSHGPIDGDTRNPRVRSEPLPEDWFTVGFDDSGWPRAKEYSEREIDPKQPYDGADFESARFIWSDDLKLDNTVIFRHTVTRPPDGRQRVDFTNLTNTVPEGPSPAGGRRPPRGRGPAGGAR